MHSSFYECPEKLCQIIESLGERLSGMEKIDPLPMGDHMLFASVGIPTIALTAPHIFTLLEEVLHTPKDDLNMMDIERLEEVVQFLIGCIEELVSS
jgi:hypothetical protein